jgi:hypothetical protein
VIWNSSHSGVDVVSGDRLRRLQYPGSTLCLCLWFLASLYARSTVIWSPKRGWIHRNHLICVKVIRYDLFLSVIFRANAQLALDHNESVYDGSTLSCPALSEPSAFSLYKKVPISTPPSLKQPSPHIVEPTSIMQIARILTFTALALPYGVQGGLIAYGVCQTGPLNIHFYDFRHFNTYPGCNQLAVACYAAAGFTFGTVIAAPATPAVLIGCNAVQGVCSAACAATALLAPTPRTIL